MWWYYHSLWILEQHIDNNDTDYNNNIYNTIYTISNYAIHTICIVSSDYIITCQLNSNNPVSQNFVHSCWDKCEIVSISHNSGSKWPNDLEGQGQWPLFSMALKVSQDACLMHIWWFQPKLVMNYLPDKIKFMDREIESWMDGCRRQQCLFGLKCQGVKGSCLPMQSQYWKMIWSAYVSLNFVKHV